MACSVLGTGDINIKHDTIFDGENVASPKVIKFPIFFIY